MKTSWREPAPWTISEANNHCVHAFEKLRVQREQGRFCDVTLSIQGRTFPAHRCVLASCSPWFDTNLKVYKTTKETVEVTQCKNYEIFHQLLTYCYTGQIIVDKNNVPELLHLSHYYAIFKLKSYCSEYLERNLNTRNCVFVLEMALKYCLSDLMKQSFSFLERNFSAIYSRPEMLNQASLASISAFLAEKSWNLSQELVLKFIALWVNADISSRKDGLHSLLDLVNWSQIDTGFLNDHLEKEALYYNSSDSLFIILNTLHRNSIYLGPKYQDIYQNLQDQDLELDDSNSFLSLAVKELEHSDVDPDWFLQSDPTNEPPTYTNTYSSSSARSGTNMQIPSGPSSNERPILNKPQPQTTSTDFDFNSVETEYQIVEQVINEQRWREERSKYKDVNSSIKRYDPKFRALTEAFRKMEDLENSSSNSIHSKNNEVLLESHSSSNGSLGQDVPKSSSGTNTGGASLHQHSSSEMINQDLRPYNTNKDYSHINISKGNELGRPESGGGSHDNRFVNYSTPQLHPQASQGNTESGKFFKYTNEISDKHGTLHEPDNRYYKFPPVSHVSSKNMNTGASEPQTSSGNNYIQTPESSLKTLQNDVIMDQRLLLREDMISSGRNDSLRYEEHKESDKYFKHPGSLVCNKPSSSIPHNSWVSIHNRGDTTSPSINEPNIYKNVESTIPITGSNLHSSSSSSSSESNILPDNQSSLNPGHHHLSESGRYAKSGVHHHSNILVEETKLPRYYPAYANKNHALDTFQPPNLPEGNVGFSSEEPCNSNMIGNDPPGGSRYNDNDHNDVPSESGEEVFMSAMDRYTRGGKGLSNPTPHIDTHHVVEAEPGVASEKVYDDPPSTSKSTSSSHFRIENNEDDLEKRSAHDSSDEVDDPVGYVVANSPRFEDDSLANSSSSDEVPRIAKIKIKKIPASMTKHIKSKNKKLSSLSPKKKIQSKASEEEEEEIVSKETKEAFVPPPSKPPPPQQQLHVKKAKLLAQHRQSEVQNNEQPQEKEDRPPPKEEEEEEVTESKEEEEESSKEESHVVPIKKAVPYQCSDCPYWTPNKTRMRFHNNMHEKSDAKNYKCPMCDVVIKWKQGLRAHIICSHIRGPPFKCDLCDYKNESLQPVLRHRKSHSEIKPFACSQCTHTTKTKKLLTAHIKRIHGSDEEKLPCSLCSKRFVARRDLELHQLSHSSEQKFICDICGFKTKYKSYLMTHSKVHTGQTLRCQLCSFSTLRRIHLDAHIKTHTGEKNFVCDVCQKAFIEKSQLKRHSVIHSGEKPFACHVCPFRSNRKDKLKNHVLKKHGSLPEKPSIDPS